MLKKTTLISEDAPGKDQGLDALLFQLERAVQVYAETHSFYARVRARELIREMRTGLEDVEHLLITTPKGLIERYSEVGRGEQDDHEEQKIDDKL